MPEISRFYGIIITMFINEHNPPHFHVRYMEMPSEWLVRLFWGRFRSRTKSATGAGTPPFLRDAYAFNGRERKRAAAVCFSTARFFFGVCLFLC